MSQRRMQSHHEEIAKAKMREARRLLAEASGLLRNDSMQTIDGSQGQQCPFGHIASHIDQASHYVVQAMHAFPPILSTW